MGGSWYEAGCGCCHVDKEGFLDTAGFGDEQRAWLLEFLGTAKDACWHGWPKRRARHLQRDVFILIR
jgi:hypothetical protein